MFIQEVPLQSGSFRSAGTRYFVHVQSATPATKKSSLAAAFDEF